MFVVLDNFIKVTIGLKCVAGWVLKEAESLRLCGADRTRGVQNIVQSRDASLTFQRHVLRLGVRRFTVTRCACPLCSIFGRGGLATTAGEAVTFFPTLGMAIA
jgi:hypothetical protein